MKCRSVACLWSGPPARHRVTAAIALTDPPTLYTGGSDGSIIWWNICALQSPQDVRPIALLCGHAATIADLCICTPMAAPPVEERPRSTVRPSNSPARHASLLSACIDGVLCVWSRGSGHCRRRRKLPPWAGTPHALSPLPLSPRYVCVACCCAESSMHTSSSQVSAPAFSEEPDRDEAGAEREAHHKKPAKWAILIVDSYSLNIVQTVFHGGLSFGPLQCLRVVPDFGNGSKHDVIMADASGKVLSMILPADHDQDGERGTGLRKSVTSEAASLVFGETSCEGANAVSISEDGALLFLVYTNRFVIQSILNTGISKEVPLADSALCNQNPYGEAHIIGGTIMQRDSAGARYELQGSEKGSATFLSVWSTNGAALIYLVRLSKNNFTVELQCEIPPLSYTTSVNVLVRFCQLGCYFLRIESVAVDICGSLLWRPHITTWVIPQLQHTPADGSGLVGRLLDARKSNNSDGTFLAVKFCEGGFADENARISASVSEDKESCGVKVDCKEEDSNRCSRSVGAVSSLWDRRAVSSSMVLSEDFHIPYTVVCGFYSGEIEIVQVQNLFSKPSLYVVPEYPGSNLCIHQQSFSGHTGAVLCLAAHRMVVASNNHNALRILISGGLDWTVRLWNLDSGDIVMVMHHHVAPVRQIILPVPGTDHPWSDCFLSVGDDSCVALLSLGTLHVERMFPGHPYSPSMVAWDSIKGYIACMCRNSSSPSDVVNCLYVWDVKTGVRERILRGTASYSMFDHFCKGINSVANPYGILDGITSGSSLTLSLNEDATTSKTPTAGVHKIIQTANANVKSTDLFDLNDPLHYSKAEAGGFTGNAVRNTLKHPIKCFCPFPGIATFEFDLSFLMSLCQISYQSNKPCNNPNNGGTGELEIQSNSSEIVVPNNSDVQSTESPGKQSFEVSLLRFSLSFLHLWNVDHELDKLLVDEMSIHKPDTFVASGVLGDRGSLTLLFPDMHSTLELWKCSSEYCAMRSLIMVSLAQRMICLSISSSTASSELAAFYTRNFAEKVPGVKPPLLQLLVSFWQESSEYVRMAARSLFHCAAPRAVPHTLYLQKMAQPTALLNSVDVAGENGQSDEDAAICKVPDPENEDSRIVHWLESYEMQDWVSYIGGTAQDAMAAHIIVAAALAVWYPSIVKPNVPKLVVEQLVKLVMALNDRYSSTAAELLAEGMDSIWKAFISNEIPRLIGDAFFQIECLSSGSANNALRNPAVAMNIRESLVGILLPNLAIADINAFLSVIESQMWSTSSDSPVHLVSLNTLIRVSRGSPKTLLPCLDKVVNYVLQTMDHGNSVMRKACIQSSKATLREIARIFPMVAINERASRLALGDAIGDVRHVSIRVYDMESATKVKVLDASGPAGLPSLLTGASDTAVTPAISALSFSPDGEGLVAFSEHGLMIRWWSLGTSWWEKLSRSTVPVQCTKLIFVPPGECFSPNSSRTSIMASLTEHHNQSNSQEKIREDDADTDCLKILLQKLDLSYRLEWLNGRKVVLTRHGQELGSFQL